MDESPPADFGICNVRIPTWMAGSAATYPLSRGWWLWAMGRFSQALSHVAPGRDCRDEVHGG